MMLIGTRVMVVRGDGGGSRRSSTPASAGGGCKRRGGGSASSGEMREREGCPGGGFIGGGEARCGVEGWGRVGAGGRGYGRGRRERRWPGPLGEVVDGAGVTGGGAAVDEAEAGRGEGGRGRRRRVSWSLSSDGAHPHRAAAWRPEQIRERPADDAKVLDELAVVTC